MGFEKGPNYLTPLFKSLNAKEIDFETLKKEKSVCIDLEPVHLMYNQRKFMNCKFVLQYGYYQSWKYFVKYKRKVLEAFQFPLEIRTQARNYMQNFLLHQNQLGHFKKSFQIVGVHIRRTDFIKESFFGYIPGERADFERFMKLERTGNNLVYLFFCDDHIWCVENFRDIALDSQFVNMNAHVSLCLMSMCDQIVILSALTTYGWWGGFLGNATVYVNKYVVRENTTYSTVNIRDRYPPHWNFF